MFETEAGQCYYRRWANGVESEEEELIPLSTTQDQVLLSFNPGNALGGRHRCFSFTCE